MSINWPHVGRFVVWIGAAVIIGCLFAWLLLSLPWQIQLALFALVIAWLVLRKPVRALWEATR